MNDYETMKQMFDNAGVVYTATHLEKSWITVETQRFGTVQPGHGERVEFVFSGDGRLEQMFVDAEEARK